MKEKHKGNGGGVALAEAPESALTIGKLTKDLKQAAKALKPGEARYLVDLYYQIQDYRISATNQVRSAEEGGEPNAFLVWNAEQMTRLESLLQRAMGIYSDEHVVGVWAKTQIGIGPVIAAGLLAHLDVSKAPYAGNFWRFAGLDPTLNWLGTEKAAAFVEEIMGKTKEVTPDIITTICQQLKRREDTITKLATKDDGTITKKSLMAALARRPWNADLKVLCWKIGGSFVKFHNHPDCFYGKLYRQRKALEVERNTSGQYAEQAKQTLEAKKFDKSTDTYKAYKEGRLPDGRIDARARRWAVKIFLAHYHAVAYQDYFKCQPPKPFVIEHLGHADLIEIPNWPLKLAS